MSDPYRPGHWTGERIMRIADSNPVDWAEKVAGHLNLQDNYIAAVEKNVRGLEARLQEMIKIFNAADISQDKLPPEKLIELGGHYEI